MKLVNGLKITAEILTGLYLAFLLITGIDGMSRGFFYLLRDLFGLAFFGFLMWGAWKNPRLGFVPVGFSIMLWLPIITGEKHPSNGYLPMIILTAPLLLIGLLFLLAAWKMPSPAIKNNPRD